MTCRSCIASSSAAWVLGGVRLISSARIMLAKIGPAMNVNLRRPVSGSSWRMSVPVMSDGIMSGVNWIRRNDRLRIFATVLTSSVLARPGTPTSRTWPRAKRPVRSCSTTSSWPMITLAISARIALVLLGQGGDGRDLVAGGFVGTGGVGHAEILSGGDRGGVVGRVDRVLQTAAPMRAMSSAGRSVLSPRPRRGS